MSHSRTVRIVTLAALAAAGCTKGADTALPSPGGHTALEQPAQASRLAPVAPPAEADQGVSQRKALGDAGPTAASSSGTSMAGLQLAGLQAMAESRKLIRTGELTLVVESYLKAADQVKRIADTHGGYLADAQVQRGAADRRLGTLTIRIGAARFDEAVAALRALGDVRSETVSAQDVTKAYTDLETRLRVKRETSDRLRAILRDRTAALSDVLEAERELARVTEEIEQAEGERRFYDQQVALSTLTVTLQEPSAVVEAGVFAPLTEAFHDSVRVLAGSLAAIVYAAVFLAPWLLIAWALWKLLRRRRARRALAANLNV